MTNRTPSLISQYLSRYSWHACLCIAAIFLSYTLANATVDRVKNEISDIQITHHIIKEFEKDDAIAAHLVAVTTRDGIVTLSGTVNNLLEQERAVYVAELVRGVRAVINTLVLVPVERNDKIIKLNCIAQLALDPVTESSEITVKVENGTVTLSGDVDSYAIKQIAEELTCGVSGIKKIINNLNVVFTTHRPDEEIKNEIVKRFTLDPLVPELSIEVTVKEGHVTLKGNIGNAAQKKAAFKDAWVDNVMSVDNKSLIVVKWENDTLLRENIPTGRPDDAIRKAVEDALFYDPRTATSKITVGAEHGIVTLTGQVPNIKAKFIAEKDAGNTIGVTDVNNYIMVQQNEITDVKLEKQLKDLLLGDPVLERFSILPVVRNKKVYLYGEVDNFYEKWRAANVVSSVMGVADIANIIKVNGDQRLQSDNEIKDDILDELYWSSVVDENNISVEVRNGLVILSGTVNSYLEYENAILNAFEGGARQVESNMNIRGVKNKKHKLYTYDDYFSWNTKGFK